ncbi:MAG: helix-turn-helix domain-containing protein [Candidatus Marinimicrobia bacterium]|nr:helix-turn-helix domain-containing protein [Candidatus Neomarinimicrobiota bacterium]
MAYGKVNIKMYTTKETAEILRVNIKTVFNYIKQGKLKPVRIGGTKKTGKTLIPQSEIEKLLK